MKPRNGDPSPVIHTLKFLIKDIDIPFFYNVSKSEKVRIENILQKTMSDKINTTNTRTVLKEFIVFETLDVKEPDVNVMIRTEYIQMLHYLWEVPVTPPSDESSEDPIPEIYRLRENRDYDIRIFFKNRKEPFTASFDSPADAALLCLGLDADPGNFDLFWTFYDIEDEEVVIRMDEIVLVEVDSVMVKEGLETLGPGDEPDE